MLGSIPRGDAIYAISQFDHKTKSKITNQPGWDKVIYVRGPVHVAANGCISLASTNLGEPRTFGISEKITLLVVDQAQARVLRNTQIAVDEGRGSSLTPDELPDLGVPLASFEFSTDPYDVPDGHGGWVSIARLPNSLDLVCWAHTLTGGMKLVEQPEKTAEQDKQFADLKAEFGGSARSVQSTLSAAAHLVEL
jgi:hypothetical protein